MKQILLACALGCLCIAGSVRSEVSGRTDTLVAGLQTILGLTAPTANVTVAKMKYALNLAVSDVARDFPAIEKSDTVISYDALEGALLNNDCLRVRGVQKKIKAQYIPLKPIEIDSAMSALGGVANTKYDRKPEQPSYYYVQDKRLRFIPKVDRENTMPDTFVVDYYADGKALTDDTVHTDIPEEYRPALLLAAAKWLYLFREMYGESDRFAALYDHEKAKLNDRKEELKK